MLILRVLLIDIHEDVLGGQGDGLANLTGLSEIIVNRTLKSDILRGIEEPHLTNREHAGDGSMLRHQIILALIRVIAEEEGLVVARGPAVSRSAAQASVVLLRNLEDMLDLWNVFGAWVIYSIWPEHLHFLLCYKTPLVAEALLGKVLAATVADGLLVEAALLFLPVAAYLGIPGVIHV